MACNLQQLESKGKYMLVYKLDDLIEKGQYTHVLYHDGLVLAEGQLEGKFISDILEIKKKKIVVSWNTDTQEGVYVEVFIRTNQKSWSPWMTYGKWCNGYNLGSQDKQVYGDVGIYIDEINSDVNINSCQVKVVLSREDAWKTVKVRDLFIVTEEIKTSGYLEIPNIDLEVPMISQMLIHDIGNIACSPTALNMILNYYGCDIQTLDVAKGCYDTGSNIYGNWTYNMAFASECGFEAYVDYCYDIRKLTFYIKRGIPIVASVRTDEIITGAPQAYPEGHLLVVRGFLQEDESYVIVNDPASKTEEDVKRYYKLEEFLKIWKHVIYVVKTRGKDEI